MKLYLQSISNDGVELKINKITQAHQSSQVIDKIQNLFSLLNIYCVNNDKSSIQKEIDNLKKLSKQQIQSQKRKSQSNNELMDDLIQDLEQHQYEQSYRSKSKSKLRAKQLKQCRISFDNDNLAQKQDTMKSDLYLYQQEALTWMLHREGKFNIRSEELLLQLDWNKYITQDGTTIYLNIKNDYTKLSKGGILADEMGLGKTVMMIALIHSDLQIIKLQRKIREKREELEKKDNIYQYLDKDIQNNNQSNIDNAIIDNHTNEQNIKKNDKHKKNQNKSEQKTLKRFNKNDGSKRMAGNLVILPLGLISQWKKEIIDHSQENSIQVLILNSQSKKDFIQDYDVVIISYHSIDSQFKKYIKKTAQETIFDFCWQRIIFDEAHCLKNQNTQMGRLCPILVAEYKWIITATPIQNQILELLPLFEIIEYEPYDTPATFTRQLVQCYQLSKSLEDVMRPIILKRTKEEVNQIQQVVKTEETIFIKLNQFEKKIYNQYYTLGIQNLNQFCEDYENVMGIYQNLNKLRQICDHVQLVQRQLMLDSNQQDDLNVQIRRFIEQRLNAEQQLKQQHRLIFQQQIRTSHSPIKQLKNNDQFQENTIKQLMEGQSQDCLICLEDNVNIMMTICCHFVCQECTMSVLNSKRGCPMCRRQLTNQDFFLIPKIEVEEEKEKDEGEEEDEDNDQDESNYMSSKEKVVFKELNNVIEKGEKVIIFTQFISMMDKLSDRLKAKNLLFQRIDGSKSIKQRDQALTIFKENADCNILIVSLKTGGVGLNLIQANHVFLIDPFWNPAIENQAIDRVHRIGQKKQVFVKRFIMKNTVEERMIELHEQKQDIDNIRSCSNRIIQIQNLKHLYKQL